MIAAVVAVILLGIGGFVYAKSFMVKTNPVTTTNSMMGETKKTGSIFSSIQDALSKNLTLQCNIKTQEGTETVSYIKNGMIKVQVTGKTPDQNGMVIMRNGKMYFWNSKSAIMMSFDLNEIQKNAAENPAAGATAQSPQNYMSMMEKYKEDCKTASVSDDVFVVPTNVKFQDISQMMKNLQNSTGSNSTNPGAAVPSINPSNYQQMMQQYQNQTQP